MRALTCAGYEYMKLMVAELQRQLNEIERSKGIKIMFCYIIPCAKKVTKQTDDHQSTDSRLF